MLEIQSMEEIINNPTMMIRVRGGCKSSFIAIQSSMRRTACSGAGEECKGHCEKKTPYGDTSSLRVKRVGERF